MQNGHYSHSHWDHHIWLLYSESSIVKSLNKGSSNQPRRIQKWMHEKIPDMLMHFWSKKSKKIYFWKVSPTSLEPTIHSTYLRKTVLQFWCKSLCFKFDSSALAFVCFEISTLLKLEISKQTNAKQTNRTLVVKYISLNFYMLLFRTINGVVCVLCAFKPACYFYGILHTYYIGKAQRFCSVVFCCQMRFSFLKCLLYFTTLPLYNLICTFCAWFLSFYGATYYVTISLNK